MSTPKTKKNVGSCIAGPTCEKVIPIYPVRYAIMPSVRSSIFEYSLENLESDFPPLNTDYCLRNLRDEGYVYIYNPEAREKEKWSCHQYNYNAGSFWSVPGFYKLKINEKDSSLEPINNKALECIELAIHEQRPTKIYMAFSDSPFSKSIMKQVETGELKSKIMQEIDIGAWIEYQETDTDNVIKLTDAQRKRINDNSCGNPVKNTISIEYMLKMNKDYTKDDMMWSENPATKKITKANIDSKIKALNSSGGLAVVLYDGVGIASELSQLVNDEVNQFQASSEINARKAWVSNTIDSLTKQAIERAKAEARSELPAHKRTYKATKSTDQTVKDNHDYLADQDYAKTHVNNVIQLHNKYNRHVERKNFMKFLPEEYQQQITKINTASETLLKWMKYTGNGSFSNAILAYDIKDIVGFQAYQGAVARSVDGLIVNRDGIQFIANLVPVEGPTGIFKKALKGHPDIISYLSKNKSAGNLYNAKEKMTQLKNLSIQPTPASRYLSFIVATILIQHKQFKEHKNLLESEYRLIFEIAEGNAVGKQDYDPIDIPGLMMKATAPDADDISAKSLKIGFKVASKTLTKISLYYIGDSDNPYLLADFPPTAQQEEAATRVNLSHKWNLRLSALATVMSVVNIHLTLKEFKGENKTALINSLSLADSLSSAAAAGSTVAQAVYQKRSVLTKAEHLNKHQNAHVKAHWDKKALKYERFGLWCTMFTSVVSILNSIAKAGNSKSKNAATLYYLTIPIHLISGSYAFYTLLSKTRKIATTGVVTTIAKGGVIRFLTSPTILILGLEVIAYILEKYAEAIEAEKEVRWIEQSIWGTNPNKQWDAKKEKYELNKLFISPKITTTQMRRTTISERTKISKGPIRITMDNSYNYDVVIMLPGYQAQVSHVEIRKNGSTNLIQLTDAIPQVAKPIIKDNEGIRYIKYKNMPIVGDINVKYWPNKFADPNTFYIATKSGDEIPRAMA